MKTKLFLAIITSLILISCEQPKSGDEQKPMAESDQVSDTNIEETVDSFTPAVLQNGTYETVCENTGTPSSIMLRSISSKKAIMYVEDTGVSILYYTYWDVDCQGGSENEHIELKIDRSTHDFLLTKYSSRWDDFYQKCELDTFGYVAGDVAEIDGIGCYMSFENEIFKIQDEVGGGYNINGVVFN